MRVLFYVLTLVFGLLGSLAVLRSLELFFFGSSLPLGHLLFGGIELFLAWWFMRKARARGASAGTTTG